MSWVMRNTDYDTVYVGQDNLEYECGSHAK